MSRTTIAELDTMLDMASAYNEADKRSARGRVRSVMLAAYREADEAPIIRDMLMESARTIARLEFEVEGLKEAAMLRTPLVMPCPETESGGAYCQLFAGHPGNHYINLEETK